MQALSKSLVASKSIFRRKAAICAVLASGLFLSGCMSSVTTTMNASHQIGEYAVASYEKLDLSDELLADALSAQRVVTATKTTSLPLVSKPENENSYELSQVGLRWVNDITGSQGQISEIVEQPSGNTTCRKFKTTRLSFSGVETYKGVSCLSSNGGWSLHSFYPVV